MRAFPFPFAVAVALGSLLACGGGVKETPWNPNLAGSLDAPLPPPAPDGGDSYPATCNVAAVQNDDGGYAQADATCYLSADLGLVWKALQDPAVTEDPHTTAFTVTSVADSNPQHPIHQLIHYELTDIISFVYDLEWVHVLDEGTLADPTHVVVTFQKVDGTSYISLWDASFELTSPTAGVTQLAMSMHENALSTSPAELQTGLMRYYTNLGQKLGVAANPP